MVIKSTSHYETLAQVQYVLDKTNVLQNEVLDGFAFQNLTNSTTDKCFLSCVENCRCMAFQVCSEIECRLLSSNKHQNPFSMVKNQDCAYYDIVNEEFAKVRKNKIRKLPK